MHDISTLIRRWQAGDENAAETIYDQHWPSICGLAYTLLGDLADAEEVPYGCHVWADMLYWYR